MHNHDNQVQNYFFHDVRTRPSPAQLLALIPKFYEGMSTAEYVRQYWGANARDLGIECGYKNEMSNAQRAASQFFAPLNYLPAAVLNGPEVIAEAE